MSVLRVGLDARMWNHTGIGRYLRNLAPALEGIALTAWAAPDDVAAVAGALPAARVLPCPARLFSLREQASWARELRRAQLDVFHAPHVNMPLLAPVPVVVTIHDLIPLRFPGTINSRLGELYYGTMACLAARRAARVIAVSEHTREDLKAMLGAAPDRIRVVGEAGDPRFGIAASPEARRALRARHALDGPYLLYAGQWKPYKNLGTLLSAFARVRERHPALKLVLAGREDPTQAHVLDRIWALGLGASVVRTGYLPEDELVTLYQEATAFVFPSRYEGFGLPPLEAMAAGVPVVASAAASLPEVVGDAGILVPPDDVIKWVEAIERVLTRPDERQSLIERGYGRVESLSWSAAASETRRVYEEARAERIP